MKRNLAEALRHETSALHAEVERTGVMRELLCGRIERASYCSLLRNLHEVYATLESALRSHAAHPLIAPIVFPKLFRGDALAADLNELHGARWKDELVLTPATRNYAARLREIESLRPELLVPHSYVRYLGDLSGGQILKRLVARIFGLTPGQGVAFFEFGTDDEVAASALAFRSGLDAIAVDAKCSAEIVAEAQRAFIMHRELFDELDAAARRRPAQSVVSREHSHLPV